MSWAALALKVQHKLDKIRPQRKEKSKADMQLNRKINCNHCLLEFTKLTTKRQHLYRITRLLVFLNKENMFDNNSNRKRRAKLINIRMNLAHFYECFCASTHNSICNLMENNHHKQERLYNNPSINKQKNIFTTLHRRSTPNSSTLRSHSKSKKSHKTIPPLPKTNKK